MLDDSTFENGDREGVGADLFPGNAPKTARDFSCLQAILELKKPRRWGRNVSNESGEQSLGPSPRWGGKARIALGLIFSSSQRV